MAAEAGAIGHLAEPSSSSLRRRVAWWLIPPLALIVLINGVLTYNGALEAANRAYDRSLTVALKAIAESIHATGGRVQADIPYSAFDMSDEGVQERIFYTVIGPDGTHLTGYPDLQPPPHYIGVVEPTIIDARYHHLPIRLGALTKRLYDPELSGGDTVIVLFAETTDARKSLAFRLFRDSLWRQLLLLAVGMVLIVIALASAFRPLVDLRNRIRGRHEEDLTPIPLRDVPNEVSPFVDAINHHMQRLANMLRARRNFLADAAHQIRTPLTVLGTQAEYGLRQNDPEEMRQTFASLLGSIRGTRRMANQMLTLARAEPANGLIQERASLDFAELVREVAGEIAPLALKKDIELALEGGNTTLPVRGNATMLREMVLNLVDNALRYTPAGGHVTLTLATREAVAVLHVVDDGPGIPEAECENVFHRFYRILGRGDSEGSGLGLAIVREICWAHGGAIRLGEAQHGSGLDVELTLPLETPAGDASPRPG